MVVVEVAGQTQCAEAVALVPLRRRALEKAEMNAIDGMDEMIDCIKVDGDGEEDGGG